jgi:hypothetical protein
MLMDISHWPLFMRIFFVVSLIITLFFAEPSRAERVELPLPVTLEQSALPDQPNSLWPAIAQSLLMTAVSGGKIVYIPLIGSGKISVVFQMSTPGQPPETADEFFRIVRHGKSSDDERARNQDLFKTMTKLCADYPVTLATMPNGIELIELEKIPMVKEKEMTNCPPAGYRFSINRFLIGADADYQAIYVARKERPSDEALLAWRTRMSEAKIVP